MSSRLVALLLAAAAPAAGAAGGAAGQVAMDPALKAQTVMIAVSRPDRSEEHGSGVILCQENQRVYVLTAQSVFAGSSGVEISFYGNSPPPVRRDSLSVHPIPGEDLLLLELPVGQVVPQATPQVAAIVDQAVEEDDRPVVFAVGFWQRRLQSWAHRQGRMLPGAGKRIHHTAEIAGGFVGGPLFSEAGALIGINVERVAGETIGAEVGSWYGEALAMAEILPAIDRRVPASCLRSASPPSELAHQIYREAMRAVTTRRWERAAELMAQALEQQPLEGGSVHLEGLRFTTYLPLYHRGLALYKLARRADDGSQAAAYYSEAIRAWERSEVQGEIQNDKRYKDLKRLKEKSYDERRRLSFAGR